MQSGNILIAIDGGGTHTRCAAFDRSGALLAASESGPSNHLIAGLDVVRDSLKRAIFTALQICHAKPSDVALVSAGLAGVDYNHAGRDDAAAILNSTGFDDCAIHSDMTIAHAAAFSGERGALAIAGTGSVFLAGQNGGPWIKSGGWGYRIGDEGGAYWIGRAALAAASRATDGRGGPTALVSGLCRSLGISRFEDVIATIYGQTMNSREIASLSRVVDETAEGGDPAAIGILVNAGKELSAGVCAVVRRAALPGDCRISYQGGVVRGSKIVRNSFEECVRKACPGAVFAAPEHEPYFGAYLLGRRELGWDSRI
jgi:N-acetylglucosamine kinase